MSDNNQHCSLEGQLSKLDLSNQSKIKRILSQELLQKLTTETSHHQSRPKTLALRSFFVRPITSLSIGMLMGISLLALAHPDTRESLANIIKSILVGESTEIVQHEPLSSLELEGVIAQWNKDLEEGRQVYIENAYGGFGEGVPKGAEPVIKQLSSLRLTARLVEFPLIVPTYFHKQIPPAYRFRYSQIFPGGGVMLFFGLGSLETMLYQNPIKKDETIIYSYSESTTDAQGNISTMTPEPQVEKLLIEGIEVVWQQHNAEMQKRLNPTMNLESLSKIEIGRFLWESDGISYQLNGKMLTKEEGQKIIASLRTFSNTN